MNVYDFLTLGCIHFPTQLLICQSVFLIHKDKRRCLGIRMLGALVIYYLLAAGWMICNQHLSQTADGIVMLLYIGYALLTAIPIQISFDISVMETIFVITGGYATQHMCFALLRIGLYSLRQSLEVAGMEMVITQYLIFAIWAAAIYYFLLRRYKEQNVFQMEDIRIVLFACMLTVAAVVLSVIYSYADGYNIYNCVLCPAYGILCCLMVLALEFYVLRENRMKREHAMMEQMLQMANAQQKSSKEAIDIINIKCHDLKHQIRELARMEDSQQRSEYLQEVQSAVSIYDATYHTGCKALDYVLREKTLMFEEYHVEFSCLADGEAISFLSAPDIYALFGNALDNALECVQKEKEEERLITLQIRRSAEMVLFHLENRCSHIPEFNEGLPLTDKEDKNNHGFGVKSIKYIAEKYNGNLIMKVKNGTFCLDILFHAQDEIENCKEYLR